jgi:hypothetical protein
METSTTSAELLQPDTRGDHDRIRVVRSGSGGEEEHTMSGPLEDTYIPATLTTDALNETHTLLAYAASSGITIDPDVSEAIASARAASENQHWSADIEAKFWPAKSKLGFCVKPVTADSLTAGSAGAAANAIRKYFRWTIILSVIIVPVSIVMFINTAISNDVGNLVKENDAAALAVHEQLVNYQSALDQAARNHSDRANQALLAPNLLEKLAQFARVSRQIFAEAQVLNFFILNAASKPEWANGTDAVRREKLELDVRAGDPTNNVFPSMINEGFQKLAVYQDIRAFAKQTQQMNLVIYGAITAYVLPVAYSLLGACAFLLRNMAAQTGTKTYRPSYFNRARLIIAFIAGTVVGLFNNFTQGVSVSPLAIAFLVGYAVEVFFSFLDAFVHTFERVRDPGATGERVAMRHMPA